MVGTGPILPVGAGIVGIDRIVGVGVIIEVSIVDFVVVVVKSRWCVFEYGGVMANGRHVFFGLLIFLVFLLFFFFFVVVVLIVNAFWTGFVCYGWKCSGSWSLVILQKLLMI